MSNEFDDVPAEMVDAIVAKNAPVCRQLTAMAHGISEEEVIRRVNEEGPEGDPVANDYWECLDEFIRQARGS